MLKICFRETFIAQGLPAFRVLAEMLRVFWLCLLKKR